MTATTAPMSIRLDAGVRQRLKAIAARQNRSAHALAAEAINQLIESQEQEYAWQQSCDEALKHFDQTGLHASHAEVMAWIATWGGASVLPVPICHP